MTAILLLLLSGLGPAANQSHVVNRQTGLALVLCARLGLPPEYIQGVFGPPDSYVTGRLDWRTNPDRYLLWDYTRYGVWVEWEASPYPRTGKGPAIQVHGSFDPN
jgi:hypothetical protein